MRTLKRHGKVLILVLFGTVTATGGWWYWLPGTHSVGQVETPQPISAAQHAALWELLDAVDLDREALIALNLTTEQAETLFTGLRTWSDVNHETLVGQQATVTAQLAGLRRLQQAVDAGTAERDQLIAARQALAAARDVLAAMHAQLSTQLVGELSASQQATWRTLQTGWGKAMPIRMVALTSEQRQAYARALRHYRMALAAAATSEQRTAAETAWQGAQSTILTADNLQVIDAYNNYAETANNTIDDAEEITLPRTEAVE